ncbi:alpha/beta hydrolase [Aporhodopirellula aestuarii]|uniref:Alpha/beta hydrolase-fold protein n=1 Tax=Aporhodopirellula aestuarii TaxID=2950107 RepID=A0ABT0U8W6_9BACT|nr:alpha/beta hydrolase-fold protein [Aporhodopirellula aestuarii]MCM2373408.1 alpha/beta hydrolase-fold protein [Aporhodopirellula aestuarii]
MFRIFCLTTCFYLLGGPLGFVGFHVVADSPDATGPNKVDAKEASKKKVKKKPAPFAWVNPIPGKLQHPSLKHGTFQSPSLGQEIGYVILLPPSYSEESSERFPVVYYLHGGRPGSETKSLSLAPIIFAAMESRQVREMIYVFVNGGPVSHYNIPDEPTKQGADVFIKELIPHVDATYHTVADRDHRGLEGFSQGGRGTMRLSLRHAELFCSAAAGGGGYETERKISESGGRESETLVFAEGDNTWDLARAYAAQKSPPVQWLIYVGTKGFNYENNLAYMKFLESLDIPFEKLIVPDVPHSGLQIYEKNGLEVMKFHARNFDNS